MTIDDLTTCVLINFLDKRARLKLGMCGIHFLFRFGFSSVFEKKTRIRFKMSLVQFGLKYAVWLGNYTYLLIII